MNLGLVLKFSLILEVIFIGFVNGLDMIIKQEREGKVCFTLHNSTLNETFHSPLVSVDLFVRYPQMIAEAGYVDLEGLTPGHHELWYKYRITNMTHGLEVKLDGENVKFTKPKIPRWYTVSLFHEVAIAFQGNFVEYDCSSNRSKEEDKGYSLSNSSAFGLGVFTSSTKNPLTKNDDETLSTNFHSIKTESEENDVKNASLNEIFLQHNLSSHINTTTNDSLTTLKLEESYHLPSAKEAVEGNETLDKEETQKPRKQNTDQINISIEISTETLNRQENLLPTILPDLNYSDFGNSGAESSQSCLNGDCEGQYNHDYTVAMCLIGILCALVLIAIVITVVFHRKKKKLMISSRARPNNRLRQQIFETEIAGESQLMLKQMENTYEEIP